MITLSVPSLIQLLLKIRAGSDIILSVSFAKPSPLPFVPNGLIGTGPEPGNGQKNPAVKLQGLYQWIL